MKQRYVFHASSSGTEAVIELGAPICFMGLVLLMMIIFYFIFPQINITGQLNRSFRLEIVFIMPSLIITYFFLKYVIKKIAHEYIVDINDYQVTVYKDTKAIYLGEIKKIKVKRDSQCYRLKIYGSNHNYVFIIRPISNPFGMGTESDFNSIEKLTDDLKEYCL